MFFNPNYQQRKALKKATQRKSSSQSFTLLELLIVIAILAILAATILLVLQPQELLKQARDANRISSLKQLSNSINFALTETGGTLDMDGSFSNTCKGETNQTIYLSLIDTTTTCQNLINQGYLASPPTNWHYHCPTSTTYQTKTNGLGWLPIDFSQVSSLQISHLPIDPKNQAQNQLFYSYICDNTNKTFELDPVLESKKFRAWGSKDRVTTDGGDSYDLYEVGTDLTLSPFNDNGLVLYLPFEEGSGTSTRDLSGHNNDGTLYNGPTWVEGKLGKALSFDGVDDYVDCGNGESLRPRNAITVVF
jgi:prepilin-type N-terminal cleavage/methylation domain-containing protein